MRALLAALLLTGVVSIHASAQAYGYIPQYTTAGLPACNADVVHRIIFDTTEGAFKRCDGAAWVRNPPAPHGSDHKSGGADAIKLDELAAPTDVTTLNATTSLHGLLRKLDGLTTTFLRGDGTWAVPAGGSTPTGTGFRHITAGAEDAAAKLVDTADINADQVTFAKIQNVSATDKVLGRSTAGAGDIEEIACTAAGRAILDDIDAAAQRTTLGLGTLATQSGTFSGTSSGTNTGDQSSIAGITGTIAQFNTALTDGDFATGGGTATGTNTGDQTTVSGNAGSATVLQTARTINGTSFDGSANITVTAAGSTLSDTVTIAKGGTGQTTAGAAFNALAPTKTGNSLKFLRVNTGETDYELVTLAGGGDALTTNPLSQFAATTSAQLAGVISNETGTGAVVLATDPALAGNPTAPTAAVDDNDTSIATTAFVQTGGPVKVLKLASNATANSTTTGVEITGLNLTVPPGTYVFQYFIRYQSAATTTGVAFAVNHTGTAAVFMANIRYQESTTAASTGAASQASFSATTLRLVSGSSTRTKATTAVNLGASISADAANSDMLVVIEGLIIVTASGDLELWHASEVAAASTVMAGTSLILTRTGA